MKYEEILHLIDGFGKYQKAILFLLVLSTVPNGFFTMVSVFMLDAPTHYCAIPDVNQTTSVELGANISVLKDYIPLVREENGDVKLSECERYDIEGEPNSTDGTDKVAVIECNHGWVYEPQYSEHTAVMEWDIVCSRTWIKPLVLSLFMGGVLVGSIISGITSDRFGRRPVFLIGTFVQFLATFCVGLANNAWTLAVAMFMAGCTSMLNYASAFVIATEIVDSSKRALVGSLEIAGFTFGYMLLPIAAYFLTQWRWLLWFMGAGGVLFIPYIWWIPESPRWLIMNGRSGAKELLHRIAEVNGKTLDNIVLESINKGSMDFTEEIGQKFTYIDLLKHPSIRTRSLIMFFIWFSVSAAYYCISLNTSNLGGNKFLNCFVAAAVELPAYISSCYLIQKFGRRAIVVAYLATAGVFCAAAPFLRSAVSDAAMITSAMLSKFAVTGVFSIIYIYCCELFPTKMRNMSVGASSTMARIGAIIAPYLIYAGERLSPYIPYLVLGAVTVFSAFIALFLPETRGVPLPETIQDAVKLERSRKVLCWRRSVPITVSQCNKDQNCASNV